MRLKQNKGITIVALTITIIILLIIAGIVLYNGKDIQSKVVGLFTLAF